MASRCLKLLRVIKSANTVRHNLLTTATVFPENVHNNKPSKVFKTEENVRYLEDPDTFGTLSRIKSHKPVLEDEGDIKEERYFSDIPLSTQKLTTKQYADIIKQYLKHKRLKEAINVLEQRMLVDDRVKPENYIYNILIGACADVGYTKKAFKLFNDMKRRGLMPTGDTYTCLFQACTNSPWSSDGLKHASQLRNLMIEKGVKPNLTNYNAMIKAFGRCGDLATAFKIVDEMVSQKIKIRVHTLNHLIQTCISDKDNGLRHAIIVWRKMLKLREKPNIYSFNLMLKCVKDCNLGTTKDIEEIIHIIQEHNMLDNSKNNLLMISPHGQNNDNIKILPGDNKSHTEVNNHCRLIEVDKVLQESVETLKESKTDNDIPLSDIDSVKTDNETSECLEKNKEVDVIDNNNVYLELVDGKQKLRNDRTVPNLLSKVINMQQVLALQEVESVQDKFTVVGGQDDFLKEMQLYNVKPDIKTFTQMLPLIDNTIEAENKLMDTMKSLDIKADIDFYNILIRKRCFRSDYDSAFVSFILFFVVFYTFSEPKYE